MSTGARIILTVEDDWWVAQDEETGVTSQGRTREAALENLDEALDGFHGAGEAPTDEQRQEEGIDPERNVSGGLDDSEIFEQRARVAPDVLGVAKVMVNSGIYQWDRTGGDHAILQWEPPDGHDADARTVPVPLHDELSIGTPRNIADLAGAKDFDRFCEWFDENR